MSKEDIADLFLILAQIGFYGALISITPGYVRMFASFFLVISITVFIIKLKLRKR